MSHTERISRIRENEKVSHIRMYTDHDLFQEGSWLKKPVKTVMDLIPHFSGHKQLRILDLGCGVGRNAIPLALSFQAIPCVVECVDILELAIEKLRENAVRFHVADRIDSIVSSLDAFPIQENRYDLILSISALEHVDSEASFAAILSEIARGIRNNGIVCLVINSQVTETDIETGAPLMPQFEVNLPAQSILDILHHTFSGWDLKKVTVTPQEYQIPRGSHISQLCTQVITFVAMNNTDS